MEKLTLQQAVLETESFLSENYEFRHNMLSGKTEMRPLGQTDDKWATMTNEVFNTIVLRAKREEIGDHWAQGIIQQVNLPFFCQSLGINEKTV